MFLKYEGNDPGTLGGNINLIFISYVFIYVNAGIFGNHVFG